jgi:hypothetical protein
MKLNDSKLNCQITCLKHLNEGFANGPVLPLATRMKLCIRRCLSPSLERRLKNYTNRGLKRLYRLTGKASKPSMPLLKRPSGFLQPGNTVRVRTLEEISATLNYWRQVKGCGFMQEMAGFCGTTQKVFKRLERFVDERDLQVKKSNGIVFLENVICRGAKDFGDCDRACFHFWREEWLEKIDELCAPLEGEAEQISHADGWVEVRPIEMIEATLDNSNSLRGCAFMPEMALFCGTKQKILKHMRRYIDESELRVKKADGIVLLENVTCHGISDLSKCDRACYYLWREEWLKKL